MIGPQPREGLAMAGLFANRAQPVVPGDGEDCVLGRSAPCGIQVTVLPG